ncbi:MAG: hypothetical protein V1676_07145 [Candidatus Diapherotrites archaeon]
MKKMCPRCGMIFEVKDDSVFCSQKCRDKFQASGLDTLKGRGIPRGPDSEIMRPKKKEG